MKTAEIERIVIQFLNRETDDLKSSQIKPIAYEVYGANNLNDKNIMSSEWGVYNVLLKLEKDGVVKNTNPVPGSEISQMILSQWMLLNNKRENS